MTPFFRRLLYEFGRLQGIGPKTAQKIAFQIISMKKEDVQSLANAILSAREKIGRCKRCFNIAEDAFCSICMNAKRMHHIICVVEQVQDVFAIEATGGYKGVYHVLNGTVSSLEGREIQQLHIKELVKRVEEEGIKEVIIATSATLAGERTASYIFDVLKEKPIKISRLAAGVPVGAEIPYTDEVTLARAIEGRYILKGGVDDSD